MRPTEVAHPKTYLKLKHYEWNYGSLILNMITKKGGDNGLHA